MDRFLDEHESPATLDRVSLPAVTAADCEQQVSHLTADDKSSAAQICVDEKPVVVVEGVDDAKPRVFNGDTFTVATSDSVAASSASHLSDSETVAYVDVSVTSRADTAVDLQNAVTAAEGTVQSADSRTSGSVDTGNFVKVPPSLCPTTDDEEIGDNQAEIMETEKVNTPDSASAAAAAVLQLDRPSSDVDAVVSESSQPPAVLSSPTTASEQQRLADDKALSDSHCHVDHETHDHGSHAATVSVTVGAELSSSDVLPESGAGVGSAVDEVKPGDVERLLAAVDSATSVAGGSLYSNVDPLTAAFEFSSATVSVGPLSKKPSTGSASQQADNVASSGEMDGVVSSLFPHSSNSLKLPVTSTACLLTVCTDVTPADVSKQDDGSLACTAVTQDTQKDVELAVVEPEVPSVPTSRSEILAAEHDVLSSAEGVDGHKPHIVHDQVSVSCMNEESSTVELNNRNDNGQCLKENDSASSTLSQSTKSCFQSNISASSSDADACSMQIDDASELHAASVKTNSDSVSLTSGDVTMLDKLGTQSCSLDDVTQSASTDSRSLLPVPSDADRTST